MSKTVVSSDNAPAAIGPYSPGIQTGNMVFLSGQLGTKAKELGSDYIVVGRPITQAADPVAAYRRCVAEFVG